jgi:hypothetical protein
MKQFQSAAIPNVVMPAAANAFCSSAVTVTVGIRATTGGDLERSNCGVWVDVGDWVDNKVGLNSALFEAQLVVNSGSGPTSGPGTGSYFSLSILRSWSFANTPGIFASGNWTLSIREIANTANNDSTVFDWDTEDGS